LLLGDAGYEGIAHAEPEHPTERSRPLIVLTACRGAAQRVDVADAPWSERVLAVRLSDGTELLNVHSPISSKPELAKVRTHEAVYAHLADDTVSHPRILCGDLNTPRKEYADGRVWTFARDQYGRLREERGSAGTERN
jgi:YD repeat-containing protein